MTNPNTMSNTNQLPDFSRMSKVDLEEWFKNSSQNMNLELAEKYMDALKNFKEQPRLETLKPWASRDEIRATVLQHIQAKGTTLTTEEQEIVNNKNADISNYMLQLFQDESKKNDDMLINMKLKDVIKDASSLSRMHNAHDLQKIKRLEADTQAYPENILDYASCMSETWIWTPIRLLKNKLQNTRKLIKEWKIKEVIDGFLQRCTEKNTDTPLVKKLKTSLLESVRKANKVFEERNRRERELQTTF